MARKGGNPDIAKHGFKKGDPRINRKGAPKKLPKLRALMRELLGHEEGTDISESPIGKIVQAMVDEVTKKTPGANRVGAAKEILDRVYGKSKSNDEQAAAPSKIEWVETKTYVKK